MKIVFTGLGLVCCGCAIWNIYKLDVKKREHHISYETYRDKTMDCGNNRGCRIDWFLWYIK